MASTVGTLIKEARTKAGLTQEQLAKTVKIITAADISKAERGEKELTQEALKEIAKATGVTQKSLLDAAKAGTSSKTTAKTSSTKTTSSKTTSSKSTSTTKSTSTANTSSMKVTATEKKLVELYRAADSDTKKAAMNLLKGKEEGGDLSELLGSLVKSFTGGDAAKTTTKSTKKDDSSDLMGTLMNALKTLK